MLYKQNIIFFDLYYREVTNLWSKREAECERGRCAEVLLAEKQTQLQDKMSESWQLENIKKREELNVVISLVPLLSHYLEERNEWITIPHKAVCHWESVPYPQNAVVTSHQVVSGQLLGVKGHN